MTKRLVSVITSIRTNGVPHRRCAAAGVCTDASDERAIMTFEDSRHRLRVVCMVSLMKHGWRAYVATSVIVCVCCSRPQHHSQVDFDSKTKKVGRHYAMRYILL